MRPLRSLAYVWTIGLAITATLLVMALAVRLLLPRANWRERPTVVNIVPTDGARDILPSSSLRISFSQPMNRHSVRQALAIQPAGADQGSFTWLNQGRDLIITPARALRPGQTYTVTLNTSAQDIWWRPLDEQVQVAFHTVEAPVILAAMPTGSQVATSSPVALVFNQAMVPDSQLGQPVEVDALRFDPPFAAHSQWIARDTLLVQPLQALQPATEYQAELAASIRDLRGTELGRSYSWNWRTRAPLLLERSPAADERWVAPDQPLVLTLSQPLPLSTLRQALRINPPTIGQLASATTLSGTQVLTFTAEPGWTPGSSYQIDFAAARAPEGTSDSWRFTVEPQPALVGQFPGQDQILPRGQSLRLIFNTPINADTLRAGINLDPPVDQLEIQVQDSEARILAALQPSRTYTLTIAATTTSRNGTLLGRESALRFRTAAASPQLDMPEVRGRVLRLPTGPAPELLVEHINVSHLQLSLFALDEPTLVRALNFSADEWRSFAPERYGRPLLRLWRVEVDGAPDEPIRTSLPIEAAAGSDLTPGTYYLRITTSEGPRADLLLIVSPISLALLQSESQLFVWAFDESSGTAVADLPLTLYRGEAVVDRGRSNAEGIWRLNAPRRGNDVPLLAIAGGPTPTLVSSRNPVAATPAPFATMNEQYRGLLFTDQNHYAPGDTVTAYGFIRRFDEDARPEYPDEDMELELELVDREGLRVGRSASATIRPDGLFDGQLALPDDLVPGIYRLQALNGELLDSSWLNVKNAQTALAFEVQNGREPTAIRLRTTIDAQPAAGIGIDWQLSAFALPPPANPEGFQFGDGTSPAQEPLQLSGSGISDTEGWLEISMDAVDLAPYGMRLAIEADLREAGAPAERMGQISLLRPAGTLVGVRASSQVARSNESISFDTLALAGDGSVAADSAVDLQIYRLLRDENGELRERIWLNRTLRSNAQGLASVGPIQLAPGTYRVEARSDSHRSTTSVYVSGPGFTSWPDPDGALTLAVSTDDIAQGTSAQLLPTMPYTSGSALLAIERGRPLSDERRDLRAGELITVTGEPALTPISAVGLVLARNTAGTPGTGMLAATTWLRVRDPDADLVTSISTGQLRYLPGQTVALSITTSRNDGTPEAADLVLALYPRDDPAASARRIEHLTQPLQGPPMQIALTPGLSGSNEAVTADLSTAPQLLDGPAFLTRLSRTDSDGRSFLRLRLPDEDRDWRLSVYASSSAGRAGQASIDLSSTSDVRAYATFPPAIRPGDQPEIALTMRNQASQPLTVSANLQVNGARLEAPARQRSELAPAATQTFAWPLRPSERSSIDMRFSYGTAGAEQRQRETLPLLDPVLNETAAASFRSTGTFSTTIVAGNVAPGARLQLTVAAGVRATVALAAEELARLPDPQLVDRAGLVLLSAELARAAPPAERNYWRQLASREVAALEAAHNSDGGWGWRPGDQSRPFASAVVVEALLKFEDIFAVKSNGLEAGIARLETLLASEQDSELRSYLWYVLRLADAADPDLGAELLAAEPDAGGLAYLALALPPDAASIALDRLIRQARPDAAAEDATALTWNIAAGSPIGGPLSLNATAALALHQLRPGSPLLPPTRQAVLNAWGVNGWPASVDSVRAAALLLATTGEAAPTGTTSLRLNGQRLGQLQPDSPYLSLELATGDFASENLLELLPSSSASRNILFVAYRLVEPAPAPARLNGATRLIAVTQDYVDPQSNRRLDAATLQPGQLVATRLTIVAIRPIAALELQAYLPANMRFVAADPSAPFFQYVYNTLEGSAAPVLATQTGEYQQRIRFSAAEVEPGIYTQTYLARVQAAGRYSAPPPQAVPVFEPELAGSGQLQQMEIALP